MVTKHDFTVQHLSWDWEGKVISFEAGKLAQQADGSVVVRLVDNVIHIASVMERNPDPDKDFMPLAIDIRDSYSAAGVIGGSQYRKREGRPSDNVTLYARLTDRALRPMFPKGMVNDVVITITPLSLDQTQDLAVMTIVGASISVMSAGIPLDGPVGAARIAYKDGAFIINPTRQELAEGMANLLVAGKKGSINMIECDAHEVSLDILKQMFALGQQHIDRSCAMQEEFLQKLRINPKQETINIPSQELLAYVSGILHTEGKMENLVGNTKVNFNELFNQYEQEVLSVCADKIADSAHADFTRNKVKMAVFTVVKKYIRHRTIAEWLRLDDRKSEDIRPLYCEVGLLPRVHGSGLFWRGDTQVLSTVTLGAPGDHEVQENMEEFDVAKRYMHHYNFPGFSTNEARMMRGPGRREIGHGKLAEKALEYMIPSQTEFPYTIRVVSDCMSSGGSTSMGSVCGSTLALMHAGVPLIKPVAGVAMGLMTEHDEDGSIHAYKVLTDLMGTEDFTGDMDFKVAGTKDGVTAIQLDTKLKGITMDIVHETLDRAFAGYMEIMNFMLETIAQPNTELSEFAPKIKVLHIKPEKVKEVIGRGGETIDKIIELSGGVKIDFEDDGRCFISHQDQASIDKAMNLILDIAEDLEIGKVYEGTVSRVEDYGLFVSLPKKKSGMAHVSKLGQHYEDHLSKYFKVGDKIKSRVTGIDDKGRINLERAL
jgi:polyribonucleotide nucleotidyltransferase